MIIVMINSRIYLIYSEYATYIDKMDSHHALVAEYELLSDTGIEISSMELTIDNLSQQGINYLQIHGYLHYFIL